MNSKIQISELRRKLRVASRVESELRSTVAAREGRIKELRSQSGRSKVERDKNSSVKQLEDMLSSERACHLIIQRTGVIERKTIRGRPRCQREIVIR